MSYQTHHGVAMITGASSGIGATYADRLAKRGYDLIVVARDEARLSTLSDRLAKETGRSVTSLRADLTNSEALAKVASRYRVASRQCLIQNDGNDCPPFKPQGEGHESRASRRGPAQSRAL